MLLSTDRTALKNLVCLMLSLSQPLGRDRWLSPGPHALWELTAC